MTSLRVLPLTDEDERIWSRLALRYSITRMCLIAYAAEESDRRDAELMLYAQKAKTASYIVRSTDQYAMNSVVWVRRGYTAAVRL
jgi:hypothetical protein